MKNRFKRVLAGIVTFAVLGVSAAVPAFAADKTDTGTGSITGNVTLNGSISPLTISVTHPVNEAYAISPDAETFTTPDVKVTNNTKVAVIATVESLKAASGGSLTFSDLNTSGALSLTANYGLAFDGRTRPTISLFFSSSSHKDTGGNWPGKSRPIFHAERGIFI